VALQQATSFSELLAADIGRLQSNAAAKADENMRMICAQVKGFNGPTRLLREDFDISLTLAK
jgi:hypothetical protein